MFLAYVAAGLTLYGVYLLGRKNKYGFIIDMFSCLLWSIVAIYTGLYGILVEVLPLFILNLHSFNKWRKENKSGKEEIKMIDAIKLLELYKASNFSGSGKYESSGKERIDEAILEIHRLVKDNEEHKKQDRFRARLVKAKIEILKNREKKK